MSRLFAWYADVPPGLPPGEARLHVGGKVGYSAWSVVHAIYAFVFLALDQTFLALSYASVCLLTVVYLWLLVRGRGGVAFVIGNIHNLTSITLTTVYTGLETGFFLFGLVGLLYATLGAWVSRTVQRLICAACGIVFISLILYGFTGAPLSPLPQNWAMGLAGVNAAATVGFLLMVALTYRRFVDIAEAALAAEYEKSEALLHNILPPPIAERLKDNADVIADRHGDVTILFADLVGFTALAGRHTPETLVALLNQVFSRFDSLAEEMGVEKIKTIGDAYMVVAGLPLPRPDHAEAVARLAIAMADAVDDVSRQSGEELQVRIGIHSGSVVAGVIGQKKFAYDIWGDAVNVAARMESHGEPGHIQISADTAALLDGAFPLEPRGEIEVKGKGRMQAFFLNRG